jgi:hypothetical protein
MQAVRAAPASMHELMLAGHSASSCDLSISVPGLEFDVQGLEQGYNRGPITNRKTSNFCDDTLTLPAPTKFCKKSSVHNYSSDHAPQCSSVESKLTMRRAWGLAIVEDEAALWSSCAEVRRYDVAAAPVSKKHCRAPFDSPISPYNPE